MAFVEFDRMLHDLTLILLKAGGCTTRWFVDAFIQEDQDTDETLSYFFKPLKSKRQYLIEFSSIVTAPVAAVLLTFEAAVIMLVYAIKTMVDLVCNPGKCGDDAYMAIIGLGMGTLALGCIVASPVINTINFVGSAYNSLTTHDSDSGEQEHTYILIPV